MCVCVRAHVRLCVCVCVCVARGGYDSKLIFVEFLYRHIIHVIYI